MSFSYLPQRWTGNEFFFTLSTPEERTEKQKYYFQTMIQRVVHNIKLAPLPLN